MVGGPLLTIQRARPFVFGSTPHSCAFVMIPLVTAMGRLVAALVRNPFVIGGVVAMAVAFFALLALLSITDLSFAIPATAASYLLETLLAKYILKEHVSYKRWIGAVLVAFGVVLVSF